MRPRIRKAPLAYMNWELEIRIQTTKKCTQYFSQTELL